MDKIRLSHPKSSKYFHIKIFLFPSMRIFLCHFKWSFWDWRAIKVNDNQAIRNEKFLLNLWESLINTFKKWEEINSVDNKKNKMHFYSCRSRDSKFSYKYSQKFSIQKRKMCYISSLNETCVRSMLSPQPILIFSFLPFFSCACLTAPASMI